MSKRKPLEPGCNGSVMCPVRGHVTQRPNRAKQVWSFAHVPLTAGQRKTLREQDDAERRTSR
jgi:hypothetical protein